MREEVVRLVQTASKLAQATVGAVDEALVKLGCTSYVKTIYVGFVLNDQMVAAIYPLERKVQVALALPEDSEEVGLIDATHLTWPTMPVALVVEEQKDVVRAALLASRAAERVRSGEHSVQRSTDVFRGRPRGGSITSRRHSGR